MVDGEVIRLRQLRERALKTRALAMAMEDSGTRSLNAALAGSARSCWRIAKVATGALRGHPNLSCQKDYSPVRAAHDWLSARFMAMIARRQNTGARVFCEALWAVARELDDTRALTWSAELSDTLGRVQLPMRQLLREFEAAMLLEARGSRRTTVASPTASPASRAPAPNAKRGPWPYMAL